MAAQTSVDRWLVRIRKELRNPAADAAQPWITLRRSDVRWLIHALDTARAKTTAAKEEPQ